MPFDVTSNRHWSVTNATGPRVPGWWDCRAAYAADAVPSSQPPVFDNFIAATEAAGRGPIMNNLEGQDPAFDDPEGFDPGEPGSSLALVETNHDYYAGAIWNADPHPFGTYRLPFTILRNRGAIWPPTWQSDSWWTDFQDISAITCPSAGGRTFIEVLKERGGYVMWPAYMIEGFHDDPKLGELDDRHLSYVEHMTEAADLMGWPHVPLAWHIVQGTNTTVVRYSTLEATVKLLQDLRGDMWGVWGVPIEGGSAFPDDDGWDRMVRGLTEPRNPICSHHAANFSGGSSPLPATVTRNQTRVVRFPQNVDRHIVLDVGTLPSTWHTSWTIIVRLYFMRSTTVGRMHWRAAVERSEPGVLDVDSDDYGDWWSMDHNPTIISSGLANMQVSNIYCDAREAQRGDRLRIRVGRWGANADDTMAGDADLFAVEVL